MRQLPKSDYREFSSFDLQDLIGKKLDFRYSDSDKDYKTVAKWSTRGDNLDDCLMIGYDCNDKIVVEIGWPSSDCPVRIVD